LHSDLSWNIGLIMIIMLTRRRKLHCLICPWPPVDLLLRLLLLLLLMLLLLLPTAAMCVFINFLLFEFAHLGLYCHLFEHFHSHFMRFVKGRGRGSLAVVRRQAVSGHGTFGTGTSTRKEASSIHGGSSIR
jgi:hypothetical protein